MNAKNNKTSSKKNLLNNNYETSDIAPGNPYLLEINKSTN